MYDRVSVIETGGVKIESRDLFQTSDCFFEVLTHIRWHNSKGVECCFCSKKDSPVLLPKKGKLSGGMTRDMDHLNTSRYRDHIPILNFIFHLSRFDAISVSKKAANNENTDKSYRDRSLASSYV